MRLMLIIRLKDHNIPRPISSSHCELPNFRSTPKCMANAPRTWLFTNCIIPHADCTLARNNLQNIHSRSASSSLQPGRQTASIRASATYARNQKSFHTHLNPSISVWPAASHPPQTFYSDSPIVAVVPDLIPLSSDFAP